MTSDASLMLRTPPIIEAVVDFECDFRPNQDFASLEAPAKNAFASDYPKSRVQFQQELRFEVADVSPITPYARKDLQAFQLLTEDEKQLVQVRTTGYSFNRLAPYSSFDDYLPEIRRTWDIYRAVALPIQVRAVRLRYINRIVLPSNHAAKLDEYFRLGPRPAENERLRFVSFLNQYTAIDVESGHLITTLLSTLQSEESGAPVIFDNAVAATVLIDPGNWSVLDETLRSLRALKNRVFRNTLQDKCLSLFQ